MVKKGLLNNISYSIGANGLNMIISFILVMLVPKAIGVTDYGYWQLYVFYTSYSGFFNIGWVEGIYLKLGGEKIETVDKEEIKSQFYLFVIYSFCISILVYFCANFIFDSPNEIYIFKMFAICTFLTITKGFFQFILQSLNMIFEYSKTLILDRAIYALLVVCALFLGIRDFKVFIILDLISRTISLFYILFLCKIFLKGKLLKSSETIKEAISNISIGLKLLISNVASMLIIGVVRIGIQNNWSIEVFGKVSLSLSICNFFMIFINAIGIVLYPALRRINKVNYKEVYSLMRSLIMTLLFFSLFFYYPLKEILILWLPNYRESLDYMAILLPICIFEGKNTLLINTFFKSLREEKWMLIANIISLIFSIFTTIVSVFVLDNLIITLCSLTLNIAFKSIISELILSKKLNVKVFKDILYELFLAIVFILLSWNIDSWIVTVVYLCIYSLYVFGKRKDLLLIYKKIKK